MELNKRETIKFIIILLLSIFIMLTIILVFTNFLPIDIHCNCENGMIFTHASFDDASNDSFCNKLCEEENLGEGFNCNGLDFNCQLINKSGGIKQNGKNNNSKRH